MPRITKTDLSAAIDARPFDPSHEATSPLAYASVGEPMQAAIAGSIARDKAAGLSGNDLRAKYGENLTGPMRRKVLRAFGLDTPQTIARSYVAYSDGTSRVGSAHARNYGPQAAERHAAAAEAVAKAEAAAAKRAARKAAREAAKAAASES